MTIYYLLIPIQGDAYWNQWQTHALKDRYCLNIFSCTKKKPQQKNPSPIICIGCHCTMTLELYIGRHIYKSSHSFFSQDYPLWWNFSCLCLTQHWISLPYLGKWCLASRLEAKMLFFQGMYVFCPDKINLHPLNVGLCSHIFLWQMYLNECPVHVQYSVIPHFSIAYHTTMLSAGTFVHIQREYNESLIPLNSPTSFTERPFAESHSCALIWICSDWII